MLIAGERLTLAFRDQAGRDHMTRTDGQEDSWDKMEDYLRSQVGTPLLSATHVNNRGAEMNTSEALASLGIGEDALTKEQRSSLEKDGYLVVDHALADDDCTKMAAEFDRLVRADTGVVVDPEEGVTRLSDLFNKSTVFDPVLALAPVLATSAHLLGEFKLHGANIREPHAGYGHQPLHSDVPKSAPEDWRVVNALIALDPVSADNGATRVVPGSQRWPHLNASEINSAPGESATGDYGATWRFPDDPGAPYPGEKKVALAVGAVAICNASLWHSGTTNGSGARRRLLHLTYTRRDCKQQFVQQDHLTPGLWERLNRAQRFLFDVRSPDSPAAGRR